jgi:hypothetical protein
MTNSRTLLAKAAFWAAGLLWYLKTPQRMYALDLAAGEFRPAGWRWGPCSVAVALLVWSEHLDPKHWDHWALQHRACESPKPCAVCGGCACDDGSGTRSSRTTR